MYYDCLIVFQPVEWEQVQISLKLLVLVLGEESSSKNVCGNKKCSWKKEMFSGTKNVPVSQNKVQKVPIAMGAKCFLLQHIIILIHVCLVWPYAASYGLLWPFMALSGIVWPYIASYGLVVFHCHGHVCPIRLSMALSNLVWSCMVLYGILWKNIVFFRGHRSTVNSFVLVIDNLQSA